MNISNGITLHGTRSASNPDLTAPSARHGETTGHYPKWLLSAPGAAACPRHHQFYLTGVLTVSKPPTSPPRTVTRQPGDVKSLAAGNRGGTDRPNPAAISSTASDPRESAISHTVFPHQLEDFRLPSPPCRWNRHPQEWPPRCFPYSRGGNNPAGAMCRLDGARISAR